MSKQIQILLDSRDVFLDGDLLYNGDGTFDFEVHSETEKMPDLKNVTIDKLKYYVNIQVIYVLTQVKF